MIAKRNGRDIEIVLTDEDIGLVRLTTFKLEESAKEKLTVLSKLYRVPVSEIIRKGINFVMRNEDFFMYFYEKYRDSDNKKKPVSIKLYRYQWNYLNDLAKRLGIGVTTLLRIIT
ncbi:MAG: hypothetical protein DRJ47_11020, partial [Thermoprotei archaeon]